MIILGVGFSSRLYDKLRNQLHLIYHLTSAHRSFSDTGFTFFETYANEENVQKITDVIFSEIKKLLKEGMIKAELQKAKNIALSGFLFGLDSASAKADFYAEQWLLKNQINPVEYFTNILDKATSTNLKEVAEFIFSDNPKINILAKSLNSIKVDF